jgi:hypothetical protein
MLLRAIVQPALPACPKIPDPAEICGLAIKALPDIPPPTSLVPLAALHFLCSPSVLRHFAAAVKAAAAVGQPPVFTAALRGIATIDRQRRNLAEREHPTRVTGARPAAAAMDLNGPKKPRFPER